MHEVRALIQQLMHALARQLQEGWIGKVIGFATMRAGERARRHRNILRRTVGRYSYDNSVG